MHDDVILGHAASSPASRLPASSPSQRPTTNQNQLWLRTDLLTVQSVAIDSIPPARAAPVVAFSAHYTNTSVVGTAASAVSGTRHPAPSTQHPALLLLTRDSDQVAAGNLNTAFTPILNPPFWAPEQRRRGGTEHAAGLNATLPHPVEQNKNNCIVSIPHLGGKTSARSNLWRGGGDAYDLIPPVIANLLVGLFLENPRMLLPVSASFRPPTSHLPPPTSHFLLPIRPPQHPSIPPLRTTERPVSVTPSALLITSSDSPTPHSPPLPSSRPERQHSPVSFYTPVTRPGSLTSPRLHIVTGPLPQCRKHSLSPRSYRVHPPNRVNPKPYRSILLYLIGPQPSLYRSQYILLSVSGLLPRCMPSFTRGTRTEAFSFVTTDRISVCQVIACRPITVTATVTVTVTVTVPVTVAEQSQHNTARQSLSAQPVQTPPRTSVSNRCGVLDQYGNDP